MELPLPVILAIAGIVAGLLALRFVKKSFDSPINRLGRIVYRDDMSDAPLMRNKVQMVAGRPDFVIASKGISTFSEFRPVEVKTSRIPSKPHASHVMQLASQGLLVEGEFGRYPRWGYVHYEEQDTRRIETFKVRLGPRARKMILELNGRLRTGNCHPRQIEVDNRCNGCMHRASCPILAAAGR